MGSSSYISNLDGEVVQHIEYVPFGEVFLEEKNSKWNTPYLFTSKELDRETGLYYFGARYQDPKLGIFISVDPLAEKYAGVSSYTYALNNPIKFVDPTGMSAEGTDPPAKGFFGRLCDRIFGSSGNNSKTTTKQNNVVVGPAEIEKVDPQSPEEQEKWRKYNEEQLLPLNKVLIAYAVIARAWETGVEGLYMKMNAPAELAPLVVNSESKMTTALAEYYPINRGAMGAWSETTLQPGTQIDRFGSGFGKYFSPRKTPFEMRALPPGNNGAYNTFEVVKPFSVQSSVIAPAFGKIGAGTQYYSPFLNTNELIEAGFIKIVE